MNTRNREQVYDDEIFPLMKRIIEVCIAHNIPMLASFCIDTDEKPGLRCTSSLLNDEIIKGVADADSLRAATHILTEGFLAFALRTTEKGLQEAVLTDTYPPGVPKGDGKVH